MQILQPQEQMILAKSPTEGSLKSSSRYEVRKMRTVMKNKKTNEIEPLAPTITSRKSYSSTQSTPILEPIIFPSILELVPFDDPIWLELIPQEIQNDPQFDLQKLINENQEYFINLLGLAMQQREQSKMQELKFHLPQKKITTYENQYRNPQPQDQSPFDPRIYESNYVIPSVTNRTQYELMSSFRHQKLLTQENFKPQFVKDQSEMCTLTSYKQDFQDWRSIKTERMQASKNLSTGSLPFVGKTSYKESFRYGGEVKTEMAKHKQLGPFIGGQMLFKESVSKSQFPQKIRDPVIRRTPSQYHQSQNCEAGYKTTFKDSFAYKVPEPIIQDRYWKQKLLQKIMEKKQ